MKNHSLITVILVVLLVMGACDSWNAPQATPSAVAVVPSTATPLPDPTPTPTSTATAIPQPTPTSTATATSEPTPTSTATSQPTPTSTATAIPQPLLTATPVPEATSTSPPTMPATASSTTEIETLVPALNRLKTFSSVNARAIAFSPDGTRFVLLTFDQGLQVFDTQTWSLAWQMSPEPPVSVVAVSPDGQRLASMAGDQLQVWDIHTGQELVAVTMEPRAGAQLDYNGNGFFLAARSGEPGKVAVVKATDGEAVGTYINQWPIRDQALAPDGPWLAVVTGQSWAPMELAVWDIFTHERRSLFSCPCLPNFSNVAFSPDTNWLAAWTMDGPVHVWKSGTWSETALLEVPFSSVSRVEFSDDSRQLAALGRVDGQGNHVRLWDVPSWQHRFDMDLGDVTWDLAFSPDGLWLASAHGQGIPRDVPPLSEGRLWRVETGTLEARMPHDDQVRIVAFDPLGRWVATAGNDAAVWELPQ